MNKKVLAMASAAIVLLGAVVFFTLSSDSKIRKTEISIGDLIENGDLKVSKLDNELLSDLFSYRFKEGSAYVYDFRRAVRVEFRKQEVANLVFSGVLTAHAARVQANKIDIIVDVQFQTARGLDKEPTKKSEKDRVHTVHLTLDRKGDTIDIRYPKGQGDEDDQAIINDIVAKWLTILPTGSEIQEAGKTAAKKKGRLDRVFNRLIGENEVGPIAVESEDTQGQYEASFVARDGEDGDIEVNKKKLRYLKSAALINITLSENKHVWNSKDGYFKLITGTESFSYGDNSFGAKSNQTFRYEFKNIIKSAFAASDLAFYTDSVDFYDEDDSRGRMKVMAGAPIKPWSEIKTMLSGVKKGTPQKKKNKVFNTLAASLKNDNNMMPNVVRAARSYAVGSEQFDMIMGAMTYSGSPEAQSGLMQLYRGQEMGVKGKDTLIQAFTMMNQPFTRISKRFLTDQFKNSPSTEIKDTAGLALGSALRNSKGEDDEETKRIRETLMNEWRNARTDPRRARVMEMLGNSGDDYFLPLLKEVYNETNNPHLKRLAVYSLRFIDTEDVTRYILEVPLKNSSIAVKGAAVEALSMHTFRKFAYEPLAAVIKNETNSSLRLKTSEILLGQQDPAIRTRARALLDTIKDSAPADFRDYIEKLNDVQA